MFTGLIEEIGKIKTIRQIGGAKRITIHAIRVMDDLKTDDSISLNGVCQTVISRTSDTFDVEAVEETIRKTTLGKFIAGRSINLERALKMGDRLGGHIVQGHADCTGTITSIIRETTGVLVTVSYNKDFSKYVVQHGSVCIDGISLTVAKKNESSLTTSVIPHTFDMTIFREYQSGTTVNLEFDILGKYIENLISPYQRDSNLNKSDYLNTFMNDL